MPSYKAICLECGRTFKAHLGWSSAGQFCSVGCQYAAHDQPQLDQHDALEKLLGRKLENE